MGTAILGAIIERLEQEDPEKRVRLGFWKPHSYRGFYEDLAFEPKQDVTVGEMLASARSALGSTFQGYKGGDYTMSEWATVWLANYGETGETLGPILLDSMLKGAPQEKEVAGGWIAFAERMPEPRYDRKHPDQPTHGMILVTNNLEARNRWDKASHVWLTSMVYVHDRAEVVDGLTLAEDGEITAYHEPCGGGPVRGLTHWRPAVAEEWEEVPHA